MQFHFNFPPFKAARIMRAGSDEVEVVWYLPIPGTKHVKYLEENVAATNIELSKRDLQRIEEVAPVGVAAGDRYPDMSNVNR